MEKQEIQMTNTILKNNQLKLNNKKMNSMKKMGQKSEHLIKENI